MEFIIIYDYLQRMISAPQFNAPVISIKIELIVTPARANNKKRRRVPALNNVSKPAPRHPSLLKNLQTQDINKQTIRNKITV
jgi:hypothetical protein